MATTTRFFEALSERAWKENDLSDITYALCMSDIKFKKFFLDFFFSDAHLDADSTVIEREHTCNRGRPDFWITDNRGKIYIVEVKIWDGNQHFKEYHEILKQRDDAQTDDASAWRRFGYIANYDLVKDIGKEESKGLCHVATWEEFAKALENYGCFDDCLVAGYLEYLKRVCSFDKFDIETDWRICTKDFVAARKFDGILCDAIMEKDLGNLGCKLYSSTRRFRSQNWMGQVFEWSINSGDLAGKRVWGWFGVKYRSEGAAVCIEFENRPGWGREVCERYKNGLHGRSLEIYAKNTNEIIGDVKKLKEFLYSILERIQKGVNLDVLRSDCLAAKSDVQPESLSKELLAMKCLPFVLENHFITDELRGQLADADYEIEMIRVSDEEVPHSHCGRYFELRTIANSDGSANECDGVQNNVVATYRCWIGVDYNEKCKCKNVDGTAGVNYGDSPALVIDIAKDFPGTSSLNGNSWGWKCVELADGQKWSDALCAARSKIVEIVKMVNQ